MREIDQHATAGLEGSQPNPAITVYDTSGPYTDPRADIDLRKGLAGARTAWIEEQGDTEILSDLSSSYGRERARGPSLAYLHFARSRQPRWAKPGRNVTQMHYARQGIVTTSQ